MEDSGENHGVLLHFMMGRDRQPTFSGQVLWAEYFPFSISFNPTITPEFSFTFPTLFLRKLRYDIFQASLLFKNREITKHVEEILLAFARVITDAAAEKLNPEDQMLLHKQCEDFYKKECNWLYKKTRL